MGTRPPHTAVPQTKPLYTTVGAPSASRLKHWTAKLPAIRSLAVVTLLWSQTMAPLKDAACVLLPSKANQLHAAEQPHDSAPNLCLHLRQDMAKRTEEYSHPQGCVTLTLAHQSTAVQCLLITSSSKHIKKQVEVGIAEQTRCCSHTDAIHRISLPILLIPWYLTFPRWTSPFVLQHQATCTSTSPTPLHYPTCIITPLSLPPAVCSVI